MLTISQLIIIWLSLTVAFPFGFNDDPENRTPINTNAIQRIVENIGNRVPDETRFLKKVFLSNRTITCNDGSQSGFYLRKSHASKKWIIFLEGGWYCYDHHSCRNRWIRQRHYMTSSHWPETKLVGGILSANEKENPYWWNANHVYIPYCTSDSWSGTKISNDDMFNFMGASIVHQVVRDLVPLGLENSTHLMLTGSSAGGTGVMINLDSVKELLHETLGLKHIGLRGVTDSGWFLDRVPYAPTGKPAVDAIRKGMNYWQGKVPKRCKQKYQSEPWRCYFGYRIYNTLKTPLFVFQWLFDEAQMDADNVGPPVTKQQWDYIHKMGDSLRQSFENVSAVFAPSCISHSVLTNDWKSVKIDDISLPEALHCWEQLPIKKARRKFRNNTMLADSPNQNKKKTKRLCRNHFKKKPSDEINLEEKPIGNKKKHKKNRSKKKLTTNEELLGNTNRGKKPRKLLTTTTITPTEHPRPQRSLIKTQRKAFSSDCSHRRLERCSWPQCNHSCPKLHNPITGEEMDFIELLKSFGLDMESVAKALGIDMTTLNNMDHTELLNLLTQQTN